MNGRTENLVLDSCVCMEFLDGRLSALLEGKLFISVVTRIEILADPKHSEQTLEKAGNFLGDVTVLPLTDDIERTATLIRRTGLPRPKLPDAVIAATAVVLKARLVTQDTMLLHLPWPGLQTIETIRSAGL